MPDKAVYFFLCALYTLFRSNVTGLSIITLSFKPVRSFAHFHYKGVDAGEVPVCIGNRYGKLQPLHQLWIPLSLSHPLM